MPLSWKRNMTAAERFNASVIKTEDCWTWLGKLSPDGYARLRVEGKTIGAHRWSYEYHNKPIPEGRHIDHLCRNRQCTNPEHLEAVLPLENWLRGEAPSVRNLRASECVNGHALIEDNILLRKNGQRQCRTCNREMLKRWRDENPEYDKARCRNCRKMRCACPAAITA